ncbi:MAG: hypothetical protein HW380_3047 [Magnetococcales bacterium]|nr:hypothetical protein [Magnetococcales bacterium]HIJ84078.1 hypothetical protein [Magnetococcales bacterium]
MSQETWTKKKPVSRYSEGPSSANKNSRRRSEKTSILANQKVERRVRNKNPAATIKHAEMVPVVRRSRTWTPFSGKDLGLRALEASVLLAAGLSVFARNGFDSLLGMFKNGREAMETFSVFPDNHAGYADENRVEPELETEGSSPLNNAIDLRENVEERKASTLQEEETGLSSEVLDDQAGALRNLVSDLRE